MFRDAPVIDADAHKLENPLVFLDYVAAPYRGRVRLVAGARGEARLEVSDRLPGGTSVRRLVPEPDPRGEDRSPYADHASALGSVFRRVRLRDMARDGVDVQVLFPTLALAYSSLADAELATALCRAYNDYVSADCAVAPTQLVPVGVVPLQDVSAATEELRRCVIDLDMPGVVLPPTVGLPHPQAPQTFPEVQATRSLAAPEHDPFFRTAQALDVALAVHPYDGTASGASHATRHLVGRRAAAQAALADLVFEGVLERFERLRFGFFEAGCGWMPDFIFGLCARWQATRGHGSLVHGSSFGREIMLDGAASQLGWFERRRRLHALRAVVSRSAGASAAPAAGRNPEEYIARGQIFLTCAPDDPGPAYLRHAFGPVGEKLACWSTGYGAWPGPPHDPVRLTSENPQLELDYVARLLSSNARRLYGPRFQARIDGTPTPRSA